MNAHHRSSKSGDFSRPLVSIGVPTYNGTAGLEKAVRSALDQQYPNLEITISDNASDDGTRAMIERLWRIAGAVGMIGRRLAQRLT